MGTIVEPCPSGKVKPFPAEVGPVADAASPVTTVLVWPAHSRSLAVAKLVRTAAQPATKILQDS
jgi:hypothetical protein